MQIDKFVVNTLKNYFVKIIEFRFLNSMINLTIICNIIFDFEIANYFFEIKRDYIYKCAKYTYINETKYVKIIEKFDYFDRNA